MSFVLDALRKSESERQRQLGPVITEFPVARPVRRSRWAMLVMGLLATINIAVLAFLLLRDAPPTGPAATPPAVTPPAGATATPPATGDPVAAPSIAAPVAILPADASPEVRPLLAEAQPPAEAFAPPPAPDPTLLPASPMMTPAQRLAAGPYVAPGLPSLDELPAEATAGIPPLSIDLHVYTDDPQRRAVFINGRRYLRGGVLAEGPTVFEITRDGAILDFRGRRFLLPRQ